jgi:hypothetical protein
MNENNKIINNLKKYIIDSDAYMSAYGKKHILNLDYNNITLGNNSGTYENLNFFKKIKSYFYFIQEIIIFKSIIFNNIFIKEYKKLCKTQNRLFNYDLIIHSIVLDILYQRKLLRDNICIIGDGKANFLSGLLLINKFQNYYKLDHHTFTDNQTEVRIDTEQEKKGERNEVELKIKNSKVHTKLKNFRSIQKIYSVNLPQSLIQDYLVIKKNNLIEDSRIKVVNTEDDLINDQTVLFLIPAKNKFLLKNKNINLFVSMFSFQEMPLSETLNYLDIIKLNKAWLYSLNREQKQMYDGIKINYQDFEISKKSKLIFEEEAKFVKYYYNLRFPFFYKKKGKVIHSLAKF